MDKVEKILWNLLIKEGTIVTRTSYYGDTTDLVKARDIKEKLNNEEYTIDWDRMSPVNDDTVDRFVGTFSPSEEVYIRFGDLYIKGEESPYKFQHEVEPKEDSYRSLVNTVLSVIEHSV